jgi:2'-5' RNA ligase
MRTFIAIDLDEEIKKNISELLRKLDRGSKNIKWVKPQGMHLTLKFLGEVTKERICEVETVLKNIAKEYRPFPLDLMGTGVFPPGSQSPRILWLGVRQSDTLIEIQSSLENKLEKLHFPKEKRTYHPHLTLGRVKIPHHLESILSILDQHRENEFGHMTVSRLTLFLSTLKPTGAEYTKLSEFPLG